MPLPTTRTSALSAGGPATPPLVLENKRGSRRKRVGPAFAELTPEKSTPELAPRGGKFSLLTFTTEVEPDEAEYLSKIDPLV